MSKDTEEFLTKQLTEDFYSRTYYSGMTTHTNIIHKDCPKPQINKPVTLRERILSSIGRYVHYHPRYLPDVNTWGWFTERGDSLLSYPYSFVNTYKSEYLPSTGLTGLSPNLGHCYCEKKVPGGILLAWEMAYKWK